MSVDDSIFQNLTDRPGHLIRRLHQIHVALFLEECGKHDLTPVQFGVLTVLVDGTVRDQVTIASMIGVKGLGLEVLRSITNQYLAIGLLNGTAIVVIAIIFDRISQAYGKRVQEHRKGGHH